MNVDHLLTKDAFATSGLGNQLNKNSPKLHYILFSLRRIRRGTQLSTTLPMGEYNIALLFLPAF